MLAGCQALGRVFQAASKERLSEVIGDPRRVVREWQLLIPRFRGPNGNEGPVLTAWALDPGRNLPHLTTARPLVR